MVSKLVDSAVRYTRGQMVAFRHPTECNPTVAGGSKDLYFFGLVADDEPVAGSPTIAIAYLRIVNGEPQRCLTRCPKPLVRPVEFFPQNLFE